MDLAQLSQLSIEQLISLLSQAQSEKNNIWMFYIIIVTTILGISFNESYQKLHVANRLFITIASGFAVWFNFTGMIINMMYINTLVDRIIQIEPEYSSILNHVGTMHLTWGITSIPMIMWILINLALFYTLWHNEFTELFRKLRK